MEERLRWAKVDDLPRLFVTSLENMTACKPHTQYYREILDWTGKSAGECLMVGNNGIEDIVASSLGIMTFHAQLQMPFDRTGHVLSSGGNWLSSSLRTSDLS
jgi:FMN phosphatase YigB (HAD superfamily)